jgi:hypothetical protein
MLTELSATVGLIGDILTFCGSVTLAWDAVNKERESKKIRQIAKLLKVPSLAKLRIEFDGIVLSDEGDVERVFIHRTAKLALVGCTLLALGFCSLLATRLIELLHVVPRS